MLKVHASRVSPIWHIDYITAGEDHVDLCAAPEELNLRYGVKVVRVDAGGTLNGLLFRQGLVAEVSLLIYPSLVEGERQSSIFRAPDLPVMVIATITSDQMTSPEGMISLSIMTLSLFVNFIKFVQLSVNAFRN